ncbi:MAG: sensor histidine kinase [Thermoanaerobaculia bacterium]
MTQKGIETAMLREGALTREDLLKIYLVLAHDLKSPIFSIDGFSELLQSDYADRLDEDGRDFLRRIRSSAGQIKRVLDDMSQLIKLLSRPDAPRPVNLQEIVEEIRLKFANLLDEGGVRFTVAGELPSVEADAEKLREALGALVCNAITFNERPPGERVVELHAIRKDGMHRICVRDNGIGVDPRYVDQIFELGLKLDKQKGTGPGYGLFIAKSVAESHGGRIEVEPAPGGGSVFCLLLPDR